MREVYGKQVFDSLEEVVDPRHTAVLVVDMQNGLASLEGYAARHGYDVSMQRKIIPPLHRLLESAREARAKIVHIQIVFDADQASTSPSEIYQSRRMFNFTSYWGAPNTREDRKPTHEVLIDGTWEGEIIPELAPQPGDFIIKKHRNSAFINTPMDQLLRSNGIKTVVVTGTSTSGCVLATAMDASYSDYYTVVVGDCVADANGKRHQTGLSLMGERFDMPTSDELMDLWARTREGVRV
jgi:nicotinamidase-related amidase